MEDQTLGGIVGRLWEIYGETNVQINNVLNIGKIQNATYNGEILGRHVKSTSTIIENCFYSSNNTNKGIGLGTVTGATTATEINESLITTLNEYVTNYNNANKENSDYIELKAWELNDTQVKFK